MEKLIKLAEKEIKILGGGEGRGGGGKIEGIW